MKNASATFSISMNANVEAFEKATKAAAGLQIAIIAKEIIDTKWYRWGKRNRLTKKAIKIAKKHNIEY